MVDFSAGTVGMNPERFSIRCKAPRGQSVFARRYRAFESRYLIMFSMSVSEESEDAMAVVSSGFRADHEILVRQVRSPKNKGFSG